MNDLSNGELENIFSSSNEEAFIDMEIPSVDIDDYNVVDATPTSTSNSKKGTSAWSGSRFTQDMQNNHTQQVKLLMNQKAVFIDAFFGLEQEVDRLT
jgi:hypothetical protein